MSCQGRRGRKRDAEEREEREESVEAEAAGWLVTPRCCREWRSQSVPLVHRIPDEKPSRRTLILEGRAWTHPQAPSQRGFNPGDPRNNHPTLVHPFACRSLLRTGSSTVWPERDVCRSFLPFSPAIAPGLYLPLLSLSHSLSLVLSLAQPPFSYYPRGTRQF